MWLTINTYLIKKFNFTYLKSATLVGITSLYLRDRLSTIHCKVEKRVKNIPHTTTMADGFGNRFPSCSLFIVFSFVAHSNIFTSTPKPLVDSKQTPLHRYGLTMFIQSSFFPMLFNPVSNRKSRFISNFESQQICANPPLIGRILYQLPIATHMQRE